MRQTTSNRSSRVLAMTVAICAGLLSACGDPTGLAPSPRDNGAGSVFSDGPPWAPDLSRIDSILDPTAMAITPHVGLGLIDGPTWQPNHSAIQSPADPPINRVRDREPVGEPNWGALTAEYAMPPDGPR